MSRRTTQSSWCHDTSRCLDALASTGSPTLPGAILSLGPKVGPHKAPVEFVVVDHADKTPMED